ncbi:MAG: metallophosphoesterase [Silvanigrellaceae bacterium]
MKFRMLLPAVLFCAFFSGSESSAQDTNPVVESEGLELGVLLFGDQGTGEEGQMIVASAMRRFCDFHRCDFGLVLGDNFYPYGVREVEDKQFQSAFEVPYAPLVMPLFVILGNHDYGTFWNRGNIKAQLDYSKKSMFWRMPSRYYSFVEKGIEFIGLDTVPLQRDGEQRRWLEKTISSSQPKHRIVFGHFPMLSGGQHGNNAFMLKSIAPQLCGNASAYVSGHDHDLQFLRLKCGLPQIVSGAAAKIRPVARIQETEYAKSTLGFAYLVLNTAGDLRVEYYDSDLHLLASFPLPALSQAVDVK